MAGRASGFMKTIKCQDTARSRTQEGTEGIYRSSPNLMTATPGGQGGEQCQLLEGVQRQRKTGVLCLQRQAGISQGWKGGQGHSSLNPKKQENGNRWGLRGHNTPGSTKWYCPQPDHQVKRKRPVQLNLSYEAMHKKEDAQRKYDPKEIL